MKPLLKTIGKPGVFYSLLFFIVIANAFDAICTISWVQAGVAVEANPLMAFLLDQSAALFFCVKMSVVILAVGILYSRRHDRLAKALVIPVVLVYAVILVMHLRVMGFPVL